MSANAEWFPMPEWMTFECPECGDVEDIDVVDAIPGVTIYPCKVCGETLKLVEEE